MPFQQIEEHIIEDQGERDDVLDDIYDRPIAEKIAENEENNNDEDQLDVTMNSIDVFPGYALI